MKLRKSYEKYHGFDAIERTSFAYFISEATWQHNGTYIDISTKRNMWRLRKVSTISTGRLIYRYMVQRLKVTSGGLLHETDYKLYSNYFENNIDLNRFREIIDVFKTKAAAFDAVAKI